MPGGSLESLRAPSSIRIRRLPSGQGPQAVRPTTGHAPASPAPSDAPSEETGNRRRSFSAPQRYGDTLAPPPSNLARQQTQAGPSAPHMSTITEGRQDNSQQFPDYYAGSYREPVETPQGESMPATPAASEYYSTPTSRVATNAEVMNDAGEAARKNRGLKRFMSSNSMGPRNENPARNEYTSDVVDLLDLVGT